MWSKLGKKFESRRRRAFLGPDASVSEFDTKTLVDGRRTPLEEKPAFSRRSTHEDPNLKQAFALFNKHSPLYSSTSSLDALRETEFTRLKQHPVTYVDFMGACIYPESLIKAHMEQLDVGVYGNTHSDSPTSTAAEEQIKLARSAVLKHFDAPADEYVCIFTPNCTGALKIVGESFPFDKSNRFVLAEDSHNSVSGIRVFAESKGAQVHYARALPNGGFNEEEMAGLLKSPRVTTSIGSSPSLVAITGQSNVTGFRPHLPSILSTAKANGFSTLLDGAALASTTPISLGSIKSTNPNDLNGRVDALAVSFYKMFGYPTGVGALIARKDFLKTLKKPWFAGGTVELVGLPYGVTYSSIDWEPFEEGTINYLSVMAIPRGLELLRRYTDPSNPVLSRRLQMLQGWLHHSLAKLRHGNGAPVVKVLTADPLSPRTPNGASYGYITSLTVLNPEGQRIPNAEVSKRAAQANISLRTGCVCNPGGALGLLGLGEKWKEVQKEMPCDDEGVPMPREEAVRILEEEYGIVRLSLGLISNFKDVWEVSNFMATFAQA